ncbi:MAG: hypothetical protein V2A54_12980 [Bacteroidota bacterium]
MKKFCVFTFMLILSASIVQGQSKIEDYAFIDITLKCADVNTSQVCVDFWNVNPVEKFKNQNPSYAKLTADSLVKCWNIFVNNYPPSRFHKMFEDGSTLCKKKNEEGYVVTTAVLVNGKAFFWYAPGSFRVGSKNELLFDCNNRVNLK